MAPSHALADEKSSVQRGKYLAVAADCAACHTAPNGGKSYAGGYGIASPIGSIYSTNITPSKKFGIGNYSLNQFKDVLRRGLRADGAHLYPAMPYTSYARLTDQDIADLYSYFMKDVPAVDAPSPVTALPFPFNIRLSMAGWNLLFLNAKPFKPDPALSDKDNRGAYLALALGHCDTCHTPRNALMAENENLSMGGSPLASWYAPNITSSKRAGIGGWSSDDVAQYLKTGDVPGKAQAAGPMAEAVEHSFQYLTDEDIGALVAYIQKIPAIENSGSVNKSQTHAREAYGQAYSVESTLRGAENVNLEKGALVYDGACASCHQPAGIGSKDGYYPQLFHNTATGSIDPSNLVSAIIYGVDRTIGQKHYFMPGFGKQSYAEELSDADIAAVANFVLVKFGNAEAKITEEQVKEIRNGGSKPLIGRVSPYIKPFLSGLLVLAIIILAYLVRLKKHD
ncbi:sorbitol dehydrogenase cytochrome c subunit [Neokomagataea thailandica NBRC 106555]|nr:sorbitol dehydrogenase cytochrome c subunit [Neokomagataea thailandica NBRC 106555]